MIGELVRVRYEILEELSISAIFENYVARDRVRNVDVCVRLLREPFSREPEFVEALRDVVEKSKTLNHPNVARVFDIDEHEGRPFLLCELVRGSTLAERIRRVAPFSPVVACEMGIGICEALEHAASKGIPHGDLCADHVVTTLEGRVAVIDFGLWESYGKSASAGGSVLARMAPYLAPEIIEGSMPTPSSDVYAAGVILFELLTGRLPYIGQTPMSILAKHTTEPVPRVRALNPAAPHVLDEIVAKALSKDSDNRYASASDLLADLRALRDALRFGRQLTWPIRPQALTVAGAESITLKEPMSMGKVAHAKARAGVAPAQPVVRRRKKLKDVEADDDVPPWLKAIVYVGSGMVVAMVLGWIILNLTKKPEVEVPNLVGLPIAEARVKAQAMGLKLTVIGEEYNDRFPQPETVVSMDPSAATPVREGAILRVRTSLGSQMVVVPDVRGVTVNEARRRLEGVGLALAPRMRQESSTQLAEGMVIKTDPANGERVERHTTLELTVSTGRRAPERPRVNTEDLMDNMWALRFRVRDSTRPVMVRVEMTDATGEPQIIFEEERPGGDEVTIEDIEGKGREATFRIYFDNNLDTTIKRTGLIT